MTTGRLTEQVETQAESLKTAWLKISRLERRAEQQQHIIDQMRQRNEELEQQTTPQAIAQRIWGHGQDQEAGAIYPADHMGRRAEHSGAKGRQGD